MPGAKEMCGQLWIMHSNKACLYTHYYVPSQCKGPLSSLPSVCVALCTLGTILAAAVSVEFSQDI